MTIISEHQQLHFAAFLLHPHWNVFQVSNTCLCRYTIYGLMLTLFRMCDHGSTLNFTKISLNVSYYSFGAENKDLWKSNLKKIASESLPQFFPLLFLDMPSVCRDPRVLLKPHLLLSLQPTCIFPYVISKEGLLVRKIPYITASLLLQAEHADSQSSVWLPPSRPLAHLAECYLLILYLRITNLYS